MKIMGWFEFGAAFVASTISFDNIEAPITFLVDTGASKTIISDKDAIRLGVDYDKLEKLEEGLIGIGGEVETFLMRDVDLRFKSESDTHKERLDMMLLRHKKLDDKIKKIPSLLGRNILNKYSLTYNASENLVELSIL